MTACVHQDIHWSYVYQVQSVSSWTKIQISFFMQHQCSPPLKKNCSSVAHPSIACKQSTYLQLIPISTGFLLNIKHSALQADWQIALERVSLLWFIIQSWTATKGGKSIWPLFALIGQSHGSGGNIVENYNSVRMMSGIWDATLIGPGYSAPSTASYASCHSLLGSL